MDGKREKASKYRKYFERSYGAPKSLNVMLSHKYEHIDVPVYSTTYPQLFFISFRMENCDSLDVHIIVEHCHMKVIFYMVEPRSGEADSIKVEHDFFINGYPDIKSMQCFVDDNNNFTITYHYLTEAINDNIQYFSTSEEFRARIILEFFRIEEREVLIVNGNIVVVINPMYFPIQRFSQLIKVPENADLKNLRIEKYDAGLWFYAPLIPISTQETFVDPYLKN